MGQRRMSGPWSGLEQALVVRQREPYWVLLEVVCIEARAVH
jgi:hypothetical protein